MRDIIKPCSKCSHKFTLTKEGQEKARKGARQFLYFCPTCQKTLQPGDVEKADQQVAPVAQPVIAKPPSIPQSPPLHSAEIKQPETAPIDRHSPDIGPGRQHDQLPADYLKDGYYDNHGGLRRWVFAEGARAVAEVLSSHTMRPTSLRRFYNQLRAIDQEFQRDKDFAAILPRLYKFRVMVTDSCQRNVVPRAFLAYIEANLALAETSHQNLRGFLEHYQSVVAYSRNARGFTPVEIVSNARLPERYLALGYFERPRPTPQKENKPILRRDVIIDFPQQLVDLFGKVQPAMTNTALRRFYSKLKAVEAKLFTKVPFEKCLENVYAFERDVAYAANREVVSGAFAAFIVKNVDLSIRDSDSLRAFVEHYQAVIAFGRAKLRP